MKAGAYPVADKRRKWKQGNLLRRKEKKKQENIKEKKEQAKTEPKTEENRNSYPAEAMASF